MYDLCYRQVIGLDGTPRAYNEKSDLWACGILLFVMLSGAIPFYCDGKQTPLCMDCRACTVSILRGGVAVSHAPPCVPVGPGAEQSRAESVFIHGGLPITNILQRRQYPFHAAHGQPS